MSATGISRDLLLQRIATEVARLQNKIVWSDFVINQALALRLLVKEQRFVPSNGTATTTGGAATATPTLSQSDVEFLCNATGQDGSCDLQTLAYLIPDLQGVQIQPVSGNPNEYDIKDLQPQFLAHQPPNNYFLDRNLGGAQIQRQNPVARQLTTYYSDNAYQNYRPASTTPTSRTQVLNYIDSYWRAIQEEKYSAQRELSYAQAAFNLIAQQAPIIDNALFSCSIDNTINNVCAGDVIQRILDNLTDLSQIQVTHDPEDTQNPAHFILAFVTNPSATQITGLIEQKEENAPAVLTPLNPGIPIAQGSQTQVNAQQAVANEAVEGLEVTPAVLAAAAVGAQPVLTRTGVQNPVTFNANTSTPALGTPQANQVAESKAATGNAPGAQAVAQPLTILSGPNPATNTQPTTVSEVNPNVVTENQAAESGIAVNTQPASEAVSNLVAGVAGITPVAAVEPPQCNTLELRTVLTYLLQTINSLLAVMILNAPPTPQIEQQFETLKPEVLAQLQTVQSNNNLTGCISELQFLSRARDIFSANTLDTQTTDAMGRLALDIEEWLLRNGMSEQEVAALIPPVQEEAIQAEQAELAAVAANPAATQAAVAEIVSAQPALPNCNPILTPYVDTILRTLETYLADIGNPTSQEQANGAWDQLDNAVQAYQTYLTEGKYTCADEIGLLNNLVAARNTIDNWDSDQGRAAAAELIREYNNFLASHYGSAIPPIELPSNIPQAPPAPLATQPNPSGGGGAAALTQEQALAQVLAQRAQRLAANAPRISQGGNITGTAAGSQGAINLSTIRASPRFQQINQQVQAQEEAEQKQNGESSFD